MGRKSDLPGRIRSKLDSVWTDEQKSRRLALEGGGRVAERLIEAVEEERWGRGWMKRKGQMKNGLPVRIACVRGDPGPRRRLGRRKVGPLKAKITVWSMLKLQEKYLEISKIRVVPPYNPVIEYILGGRITNRKSKANRKQQKRTPNGIFNIYCTGTYIEINRFRGGCLNRHMIKRKQRIEVVRKDMMSSVP